MPKENVNFFLKRKKNDQEFPHSNNKILKQAQSPSKYSCVRLPRMKLVLAGGLCFGMGTVFTMDHA
jgi:hypothetical protein